MSIGEQIYRRRTDLSMTQEQLARKLNVNPNTISCWERGVNIPSAEKMPELAKCIRVSVAWLYEEAGAREPKWQLHDTMFSIDRMLMRVKDAAYEYEMSDTLLALEIMQKKHAGQKRKSLLREDVPYIYHPLLIACHALSFGWYEDELIAACLLHDVIEDCEVKQGELDCLKEEILEAVRLVSFDKKNGQTKQNYYEGIRTNRIASIVKLLDRCNNISTMTTAFTRKRMEEYIDETEAYVIPLLEYMKSLYPEYYNQMFLLNYQMKSVMETLKRTL